MTVDRTKLFVSDALAARLEAICAADNRLMAQAAARLDPEVGARSIDVAGGVAAFVAPDAPVNHACGMGMSGEVSDGDVERVVDFFRGAGVVSVVSVCPHAHPSLTQSLARAGFVPDEFENVLVRELGAHNAVDPAVERGVEIVEALLDDQREAWVLAVAAGFSDPLPVVPAQIRLGTVIAQRDGVRLFLAMVDGIVAAAALLSISGGVAWLAADTTLPAFRGRGLQQALQRHRMALGARAGCELAVTEARPGSGSQRNMERLGFRVAYTRVDVTRA